MIKTPKFFSTTSIVMRSHTPWSETYEGLHQIVYEIIPNNTHQLEAKTSSLCQLSIVSSHQLIEMSLYDLLEKFIGSQISNSQYKKANFHTALTELVGLATGRYIDMKTEPFFSSDNLRIRRNSTVHKTPSLATPQMARSALYTAVETCIALYKHFEEEFPYLWIVDQYPCSYKKLFSEVKLLGK